MARQMPKHLQELLGKLHDPDTIKSIQGRWNEFVAANEQYEQNYPQQFANQVEGNLKFKEQKSIPTPAEQMAMFEDMVREEIEEHLDVKEVEEKDKVYGLEHKEVADVANPEVTDKDRNKVIDFQVNFEDRGLRETPNPEVKRNDIEQSQELNVVWLQEYKEQKAKEAQEPDLDKEPEQVEPDKPYELNLTFGRLDDLDKSGPEIEPEEPGLEPGEA